LPTPSRFTDLIAATASSISAAETGDAMSPVAATSATIIRDDILKVLVE
jgi:hypothetical protein